MTPYTALYRKNVDFIKESVKKSLKKVQKKEKATGNESDGLDLTEKTISKVFSDCLQHPEP